MIFKSSGDMSPLLLILVVNGDDVTVTPNFSKRTCITKKAANSCKKCFMSQLVTRICNILDKLHEWLFPRQAPCFVGISYESSMHGCYFLDKLHAMLLFIMQAPCMVVIS